MTARTVRAPAAPFDPRRPQRPPENCHTKLKSYPQQGHNKTTQMHEGTGKQPRK